MEECCKVNCGQKKKKKFQHWWWTQQAKSFTTRPFHAIIRKLTYLQTNLFRTFRSFSRPPSADRRKVSTSRGKRSSFRVNDLYMPRQSLRVILTHDIFFNLARLMQWIEKCAQIHSGFCTLGMSIFLRAYWLRSTRECSVDYPSSDLACHGKREPEFRPLWVLDAARVSYLNQSPDSIRLRTEAVFVG